MSCNITVRYAVTNCSINIRDVSRWATLPVHAAGAERSQFLMITGFNPRSVQAVKVHCSFCPSEKH